MPPLIWIDPPPPAAPMLDPDPLLASLLVGRVTGPEAVADFLDPRPRPAPDPFALPAMDAAAERIGRAISGGETIALYGDYDVDGVTSVALLSSAFRSAGSAPARLLTRLPTRGEGYGLNAAAIDALASAGATLLVAVDCGSTDREQVAHAQAKKLDVVVLDHHQMDGPTPAGATVVSAQLAEDGPYRDLVAAGVAYLLAVALSRRGFDVGDGPGAEPTSLLDLVALGTIGDVAPLTGVNRALVRDGLRRIVERPRPGLRALAERAGVALAGLDADQVAFKIAPRLNAAGRMADPKLALDLVLADAPADAKRLADQLEQLNARRRVESQRVVAEAEALVSDRPDLANRRVLVLARPGWGTGVLGLAAGRLAERFGRPVLVLNDDGHVSRGSARSVAGFDITRALTGCSDLLQAHGGHSQAAGVTLASDRVPELEDTLDAACLAAGLPPAGPPAVTLHADLPIERLSMATAQLLARMEPFGRGNPQPVLRLRDVTVRSYTTIGRDGSHLKMHLETTRGIVPALCWGAAERSRELTLRPRLDMAVTVGTDVWNGQRRLHVEAKDFRPSS